MAKNLKIVNARENNLKDISLEIPHDQFTVITGLSGSGKSSLAFDTIFAEGQRRYLETFSSYTRQFFDQVKKPDADLIQNVRPAIAIEQKTRIKSSRSTVGSVSGINDYLKIIWNYFAEPVCPACDTAIDMFTPNKAAQRITSILKLYQDTVFAVCAPISLHHMGTGRDSFIKGELERLKLLGFSRVIIPAIISDSATIIELQDLKPSDLKKSESILLLIERVRYRSHNIAAISEIVDRSYALSGNECLLMEISSTTTSKRRAFLNIINSPFQQNITSTFYKVYEFNKTPHCKYALTTIKPKRISLFSSNNPYGACTECKGFGSVLRIDPIKCVPDPRLSIDEGAIACWNGDSAAAQLKSLKKFCIKNKISTNKPWSELSVEQTNLIYNNKSTDYRGIFLWFKRLERKIYKTHVRVFISRYRTESKCPECIGKRFNQSALAYKISGNNIGDISDLPILTLLEWTEHLYKNNRDNIPHQITHVFTQLIARLKYLEEVGLPYLTLNRQSNTLSGGETQRVNLATAVGSNLVSTQFVLDEPTVGLHARDTARLIKTIKNLKDRGNSLLVVEHDPDVIDQGDHIIEIGPKAGSEGGQIIYNGPRALWTGIQDKNYIKKDSNRKSNQYLTVKNATIRNLKNLTVSIPLNSLVVISGVSGSGKSTLIKEVLVDGYNNYKIGKSSNGVESIDGFSFFDDLVLVDQSPISKTPRGNISTYSGIWGEVRNILAKSEDAQLRKLNKSSFSFNVDGGRCPDCKGAGFIKEDMQFLSDVYIECETCLGKRFKQIVLEVSYKGKSVAEILDLTIKDSAKLFSDSNFITEAANTLINLGLGYLRLGHSLSELSGGEAQRLKLASYLQGKSNKKCLFLFDEPTTGLHLKDINCLLALFHDLIERGHSIVTVEHNLNFISACNWIIDIGPEGGQGGGRVLFEGSVNDLVKSPDISYTARFLNQYLSTTTNSGGTVIKLKKDRSKNISDKSPSVNHEVYLQNDQIGFLKIIGAREHNLKNLTLDLPLNKLVVFCGVSGSGKSSIAKDIIYAEGQRSYLDCLSPYARQFIKELKHPEIDSISGLPPTICVYQHTFQPGANSTVGTMSEVYNYLRLLFAKIGIQHCPDHPDQIISPLSAQEIRESIYSMGSKSIKILSPIIKGRKGLHKNIIERALELEISQVRIDGKITETSRYIEGLERNKIHDIDYVIASFSPQFAPAELVESAINQALALGSGSIKVLSEQSEVIFSTSRTCSICKRGFLKPDPEDLSFSSSRGRCKKCEGSGVVNHQTCNNCNGSRIGEIGLNLRIDNKSIHDLSLLRLDDLKKIFNKLALSSREEKLSNLLIAEIFQRIDLLIELGLEYLPLYRSCHALSGGELQRLRLAAALGSSLSGVMYILDEPSAGLHPIDNRRVLSKLVKLKGGGNSIVIIEHDPETILCGDYIIDIGPDGGKHGGEIVYQGDRDQFLKCKESKTAQEILKRNQPQIPLKNDTKEFSKFLSVEGSLNNISELSVKLPLGQLIGVIGVSGSGKSTLVQKMIGETIIDGTYSQNKTQWKSKHATVISDIEITNLNIIDQKPVGKNSRSIPASYLGIWDDIRKAFALTPEAKSRGWKESHFSFNAGKGRCPECKGLGEIVLEMNFLPSARLPCEKCRGLRYTDETMSIRYANHSINEILSLTIEDAKNLFSNHKKIHKVLKKATELGIGYLTLGQSTATLSGGEAQRLKLTLELSKIKNTHSLYILDEPTSGLHLNDIVRLINALKELVNKGHSVIVIEHDIQIIQSCDYLIEMGPAAAENGGNIVFQGCYKDLIQASTPWGSTINNDPTSYKLMNERSY